MIAKSAQRFSEKIMLEQRAIRCVASRGDQ